jgi:hypothetical protein
LAKGGGGAVLNVLSVLSWCTSPDRPLSPGAPRPTGRAEVVADDISRPVQSGLSGGVTGLYPQFA